LIECHTGLISTIADEGTDVDAQDEGMDAAEGGMEVDEGEWIEAEDIGRRQRAEGNAEDEDEGGADEA